MEIRGADFGTTKIIMSIAKVGNNNFSYFDTDLVSFITILRSLDVVNNFIIGGCINGTAAIYEYAITAVTPKISGDRVAAKKIVVGPSAPPIIAIDAASFSPKSIPKFPAKIAPQKATKIPICAAAPNKSVLGLAIIGAKSVKDPIPKKIIGGKKFQYDNP